MSITGLSNTIPHWEDAPEEWDRLTIGSNVMPGVWDIDFSCRRGIDVKKSKGKDGARLKDEGYSPPIIELIGKIATREQWESLQSIIPTLHPKKKGEARKQYGIGHPKTRLLGISQVYITEVKAPSLVKGIMTIVLNAIEYVPVPKVVKPTVKPPEVYTPNFDAPIRMPSSQKPP